MMIIAGLTNCMRLAAGQEASTFGDSQRPEIKALDSSARTSLEVSLIGACTRLDALLAEEKRWHVPDRDLHEIGIKCFEQQLIMQQQTIRNTELQLKALGQRLDDETNSLRMLLHQAVLDQLQKNGGPGPSGAGSPPPPEPFGPA